MIRWKDHDDGVGIASAQIGERQKDARRRIAIGRLQEQFTDRPPAQLGTDLAVMVESRHDHGRSGDVSAVARSTVC